MGVQTENDRITADESAFVAQFAAQGAPPAPVAGIKVDPKAVAGDPPVVAEPAPALPDAEPAVVTDPAARLGAVEDPDAVTQPDGEDEDADEGITDEAFQAAMAAERAPLTLDGIPEAALPVVKRKLKDLEGGFTRAMQKVADERKALADVRAEERFRTERPADFIVTMLEANPELMGQVNERLDQFQASPMSREAHRVIVENERSKAKDAERKELAAEKERGKRSDELTKVGRAAAKAAGVPFEAGVEAEIAAHLAIGTDLTETDIRHIAENKARVWKAELRKLDRDKSTKYVTEKVKDRKTAGLAVRPASGITPAPAPVKPPTNDDEFIAQFVGKT